MDSQEKESDRNEVLTNECDESTISDVTTTPKQKSIGELNSPRNRSFAYHDMHSPPRTSRRLKIPLEFVLNDENAQSFKSHKTSRTFKTCNSSNSSNSSSLYTCVSETKHDSVNTSNKKKGLLSEDPPLRNTIIFLILLRVVATNQNSNSTYYSVKSFKKKIYSNSKCAYTRLFLCMDLNSPTGQIVYIGEGRCVGMNLWSRISSV